MEQVNFGYSFKDIPLPDDKTYLQILIESWEKSDKQMRWRIFKVLHPEAFKNNGKNNFGFRTSAKAPKPKPDCPSYKPFMEFTKGMLDLIQNVKFNKKSNAHLERLKADIAKISKEERVLMFADKTSNLYLVQPEKYRELLHKSVQKDYKKSSVEAVLSDEKAQFEVVKKLEIADRVHRTAQRDSFVTLKDHKPGFRSNPQCRLINPTKPELGRASKKLLDRINSGVRSKTKLRQWRRTKEVRDWFVGLEQKEALTFLKFDVEAMYPSISEELLSKSLEWAGTLVEIKEEELEVINATKKALLYSDGQPWTKKGEEDFDIPMGSFDGAEVCELVGLYLLHLLKDTKQDLGLYRDDMLGVTRLRGRPADLCPQPVQPPSFGTEEHWTWRQQAPVHAQCQRGPLPAGCPSLPGGPPEEQAHPHPRIRARGACGHPPPPCPTKRLQPGGRGQGTSSGGTRPTRSTSTPTSAPSSWP